MELKKEINTEKSMKQKLIPPKKINKIDKTLTRLKKKKRDKATHQYQE